MPNKEGQPDRAVRLVSTGAALLSLAVLSDSAVEHYRGSFRNPAMVLPLIASTLSIGIAGERTANVRSERLPGVRGIIEAGSRSEDGRVGKEFVRTCRSQWSRYNKKKKQKQ